MPSLPPTIQQEFIRLMRSFLAAVAAAACLAALNWIGAHIPDAVSFLTTVAFVQGAQHMGV